MNTDPSSCLGTRSKISPAIFIHCRSLMAARVHIWCGSHYERSGSSCASDKPPYFSRGKTGGDLLLLCRYALLINLLQRRGWRGGCCGGGGGGSLSLTGYWLLLQTNQCLWLMEHKDLIPATFWNSMSFLFWKKEEMVLNLNNVFVRQISVVS